MICAEQIPMEVKLRLRAILHDGETDEARAIAAALNAWPGAFPWTFNGPLTGTGFVLPMPQEPQ